MEITFAEVLLFLAVGALIYRLLRPFQHRLENLIRKTLRASSARASRTVIDVTDESRARGRTQRD